MRILWLCNIMLPFVAKHLGMEASNKEGWLTGLSTAILERQRENEIELGIAFPVASELKEHKYRIPFGKTAATCYGFVEHTDRPEIYDHQIEEQLADILEDFKPDVVHCFGTEYPHTLAMTKAFDKPNRTLIGIQGLCAVYADAYMADLPEWVQRRVTLRDFLKRDSLPVQRDKFIQRGWHEIQAVQNTGHVTGRTPWDKKFSAQWNPDAAYHFMNETLRGNFYEGQWDRQACEPYSIFLSQGDYPIKGLHFMLLALPSILEKYPAAKVYVAGNNIVKHSSLKDRLKLSSYGKYLLELIRENKLEDKIVFLGRLDSETMKKQYLKSHLFVCPSSIENSPNSVGEAMILGMPVIAANVGGIQGILTNKKDGILYEGYEGRWKMRMAEYETGRKTKYKTGTHENSRAVAQAETLAEAVCSMWGDEDKQAQYCLNARAHARQTHDRVKNYQRLVEIYREIVQ